MTELIGILSQHFQCVNDYDDEWATSSAECNYENFEEFTASSHHTFLDNPAHGVILKDLSKMLTKLSLDKTEIDLLDTFETSDVNVLKFLLLCWTLLENAKNSESSTEEVKAGIDAACVLLEMSTMKNANAAKIFQEALFQRSIKLFRNCTLSVKYGDDSKSKKKGKKKTEEENEDEEAEVVAGPPKISSEDAEDYLRKLHESLYIFFFKGRIPLNSECMTMVLDMLEDASRLDLKRSSKGFHVKDGKEFRTLTKWVDRAVAMYHVLCDARFESYPLSVYGRIVRPRLSLLNFAGDGKTTGLSSDRTGWCDIMTLFVIARLARKPEEFEMKLIRLTMAQVYYQCADRQDFRNNISQCLAKLVDALPYELKYDFVQKMALFAKMKQSNVKQLSVELAPLLLHIDLSQGDPGQVDDPHVQIDSDEEEEKEEKEPEVPDEDDEENSDDDEQEVEKKKEKKKQKEAKKKAAEEVIVDRIDPNQILYTIIILGCIDKTPSVRYRAIAHFMKLVESDETFELLVKYCDKLSSDHTPDVIEEVENTSEDQNENQDQAILKKLEVLQRLNEGDRNEEDLVLAIICRLLNDEKAPVRKTTCAAAKVFMRRTQEERKFKEILNRLEVLCRDKTQVVRKQAAETMTELMMEEDLRFRDCLVKTWLTMVFKLVDDAESDVQELAKRLVLMVVAPLLEKPSQFTWFVLGAIEKRIEQRDYFMYTLDEAVREKWIKPSVMEVMKKRLEELPDDPSAWMVFSQLSVSFKQNVDFALAAWDRIDLDQKCPHVVYVVHILLFNMEKIKTLVRKDLQSVLENSLMSFRLFPTHARDVYLLLAKLMDGVGDGARHSEKLADYARKLLDHCFEDLIIAVSVHKEKEKWAKQGPRIERLLISAMAIVVEAITLSPKVVVAYERFAKMLAMVVGSHEEGSEDDKINPEIPLMSRPASALSTVSGATNNQPTTTDESKGILFSPNVRASAARVLASMIIVHDKMLKLMPMFVKQLQVNPSYEVRATIMVAVADISGVYKTDRYGPVLSACLSDPSVLIRRQAIHQLTRLVAVSIIRFKGEVMIRMMMTVLDENEKVREDIHVCLNEFMQQETKDFIPSNFVDYMIYFTQARRQSVVSKDGTNKGEKEALPHASRIALYNFMIETLDDRQRFDVKRDICQKILDPMLNGEYDFDEANVKCLVDDALMIMASQEMKVHVELGKSNSDNDLEEVPEEVIANAKGFLQSVYLASYMNTIVPTIIATRDFLKSLKSPLLRKCILAIRMICYEHKNDMDTILKGNKQLEKEMKFELRRVEERQMEANIVLDRCIAKVREYKQQATKLAANPQLPPVAEEDDEEMPPSTPARRQQADPSTPMPTKTPRALSPKTVRRLRKSIGVILSENAVNLKPIVFEDTVVNNPEETPIPPSAPSPKKAAEDPEDKTLMETEPATSSESVEDVKTTAETHAEETPEVSKESADTVPTQEKAVEEEEEKEEQNAEKEHIPPSELSVNVTLRRKSRRTTGNTTQSEKRTGTDRQESPESENFTKPKSTEDKRSRLSSLALDESVIEGRGRLCSTPVSKSDHDITFGDLNLSVISAPITKKPRVLRPSMLEDVPE